MTCEQFLSISTKTCDEVTTAEVGAMMRHMQGCQDCRKKAEEWSDGVDPQADADAAELIAALKADKEW